MITIIVTNILKNSLEDCRMDYAIHRNKFVEAVSDDESIAVSLSSEPPFDAYPSYPTGGGVELARLPNRLLRSRSARSRCWAT